MGYKKVCLDCRISLNRKFDSGSDKTYPCAECGKPMTLLPHRFKQPGKTDEKKWETVRYLIANGFYYQHIYKMTELNYILTDQEKYADYPDNMRDAKEFVVKYTEQARK
jgi:hypothetical protein